MPCRRHDDSEEEEGKRSSKKHRKDKTKDKERLTVSPSEAVAEPEGALPEEKPGPEEAGKTRQQGSDSEEGQL